MRPKVEMAISLASGASPYFWTYVGVPCRVARSSNDSLADMLLLRGPEHDFLQV